MIMLALTLLSPMPTATIGGEKKKDVRDFEMYTTSTSIAYEHLLIEVWIIKVKPNMKSSFILIGIFITSEISALIL